MSVTLPQLMTQHSGRTAPLPRRTNWPRVMRSWWKKPLKRDWRSSGRGATPQAEATQKIAA